MNDTNWVKMAGDRTPDRNRQLFNQAVTELSQFIPVANRADIKYIDIRTHGSYTPDGEGPVYRFFGNGVMEKGVPAMKPVLDVQRRTPGYAARDTAKEMVRTLVRSLDQARLSNWAEAQRLSDKLEGAAHQHLADHAAAVAQVLRGLIDQIETEGS